jgi:hypothetical protein
MLCFFKHENVSDKSNQLHFSVPASLDSFRSEVVILSILIGHHAIFLGVETHSSINTCQAAGFSSLDSLFNKWMVKMWRVHLY